MKIIYHRIIGTLIFVISIIGLIICYGLRDSLMTVFLVIFFVFLILVAAMAFFPIDHQDPPKKEKDEQPLSTKLITERFIRGIFFNR